VTKLTFLMTLLTAFVVSCGAREAGSRKIHSTDAVYPAAGPYSQMVQVNNLYFLSGVIPLNSQGSAIQGDDIEGQTRQVIEYIAAKLESQNMSLENVVMSNVYMTDLSEVGAMNRVYGEYFSVRPPARATVGVSSLPRGVKVEISVIASK